MTEQHMEEYGKKFVITWQAAKTPQEVAKAFNKPFKTLAAHASYLRKHKVNLKKFRGGMWSGRGYNYGELARLAKRTPVA